MPILEACGAGHCLDKRADSVLDAQRVVAKKETAMASAGSWRLGLSGNAIGGALLALTYLVAQQLQHLLGLLIGLRHHRRAGLLQDAGA